MRLICYFKFKSKSGTIRFHKNIVELLHCQVDKYVMKVKKAIESENMILKEFGITYPSELKYLSIDISRSLHIEVEELSDNLKILYKVNKKTFNSYIDKFIFGKN